VTSWAEQQELSGLFTILSQLINMTTSPSPLKGLQTTLQGLASAEPITTLGRPARICAQSLIHKLTPEDSEPLSSPTRTPSSDEIYKIKNLNTGEELDLRDESKDDFARRLSKLLAQEEYSEALEVF